MTFSPLRIGASPPWRADSRCSCRCARVTTYGHGNKAQRVWGKLQLAGQRHRFRGTWAGSGAGGTWAESGAPSERGVCPTHLLHGVPEVAKQMVTLSLVVARELLFSLDFVPDLLEKAVHGCGAATHALTFSGDGTGACSRLRRWLRRTAGARSPPTDAHRGQRVREREAAPPPVRATRGRAQACRRGPAGSCESLHGSV